MASTGSALSNLPQAWLGNSLVKYGHMWAAARAYEKDKFDNHMAKIFAASKGSSIPTTTPQFTMDEVHF